MSLFLQTPTFLTSTLVVQLAFSDGLFQQDNEPCQTVKNAQEWFAEHHTEFEVLAWPSFSTDLNVIEHLKSDPWSPGRTCCYRCGARYRTPSEVLCLAVPWQVWLVLAQYTIIDGSSIAVYAHIDTHCTSKFAVRWHTQAQKVHPHTQTHSE